MEALPIVEVSSPPHPRSNSCISCRSRTGKGARIIPPTLGAVRGALMRGGSFSRGRLGLASSVRKAILREDLAAGRGAVRASQRSRRAFVATVAGIMEAHTGLRIIQMCR